METILGDVGDLGPCALKMGTGEGFKSNPNLTDAEGHFVSEQFGSNMAIRSVSRELLLLFWFISTHKNDNWGKKKKEKSNYL